MSTRWHFLHRFTRLIVLSFLAVVLVLGGCGKDSPVSNGEGNGDDKPPPPTAFPDSVQLTIRLISWNDLSGSGPVEEIPADIDEIRFEISATDIQTQTTTVPSSQSTIEATFKTKTGTGRKIYVQAFNASDALIYTATKFLDVVDSVLTSAVGMVSATDATAPVFGGAVAAVTISDTYVLLQWSAATDGGSPESELLYLIYLSTDAGSMDYSSPDYTSAPGDTSILIADLDPGTTYHTVVRSMDRAGNTDTNTTMQTFSTASASNALYVNVNTGTDIPSCGSAGSPCKTITYALTKTTGNQTIHVAKGTYSSASGETFPLQLKSGTILDGEGFWWMGMKVIKETYIEGTSPVILGADNTSIIACYIKPTGWGTSPRAIDDDGHPMTIFHCTIDGDLNPSSTGVGFSAGSSLIDSRVEGFNAGGGRAVSVWGAGGAVIAGNKVFDCIQGIFMQAPNIIVSHNTVEDIASVGISVGTRDYVVDDVVIFHNHISNTVGNGVSIINTDSAEILYNSISHMVGYGISVNQQQPSHMVDIKNNSISNGASAGIWLTSGGANINGNAIVCNIAGVFLSTDQVVDLRWNMWDNDPPTINPGRGAYDPGCDGSYDICYQRDYSSTPEPLYQPDSGKGSCLVGVIPSPPK